MATETDRMDQVLDIANNMCQKKYRMSIYEKCGLEVSNIGILKRLLAEEETGTSLSKGTLDFLDSLPASSATLASIIGGAVFLPISALFGPIGISAGVATNPLGAKALLNKQVADILRQLYSSPKLKKAYNTVRQHIDNRGISPHDAAEELLTFLEL